MEVCSHSVQRRARLGERRRTARGKDGQGALCGTLGTAADRSVKVEAANRLEALRETASNIRVYGGR
jgi:hypothetical protein